MYYQSCLSVAPMLQWTDRYWRYFVRQITSETLLYTEMVMDNAIINNVSSLEYFMGHSNIEHPLAIQLGGNNADQLAAASELCESFSSFHEINLNCGCPSNKAKKGCFGAELMLHPQLVTTIVYNMNRRVTNTDITVKCRLGVTGRESWEDLIEFIHAVRLGGVKKVIVHARSCVLKGLSPAQNRTIPPLRHNDVHKLVSTFPDMKIVLNGGIASLDEALEHLGKSLRPRENNDNDDNNIPRAKKIRTESENNNKASSTSESDESNQAKPDGIAPCCSALTTEGDDRLPPVHGVMIGRAVYHNPWMLADADTLFFEKKSIPCTRRRVAEAYLDFAQHMHDTAAPDSGIPNLAKPLHHFFHGTVFTKSYKHSLDELLKDSIGRRKREHLGIADIFWEAVRDADVSDEFLDAVVNTLVER